MSNYVVLAIFKVFFFIITSAFFSGCAIYYRDRDSGAEHIWGFGHLSLNVTAPSEGKQAIIQRATLTGISASMDDGSLGISAGYDRREHIIIYDENTVITIQRPPSNDFFYFKIGSLPIELNKESNITSPNTKKGD